MSSDNDSDLDNVIEGIFQDLDDDKRKSVTSIYKATPSVLPTKSADKEMLQTNQEKSVRFQDQTKSDSMFTKLAPSNLLTSMFFSEDTNKEPLSTNDLEDIPKSSGSTIIGGSKATNDDDWLGITSKKPEVPTQSKSRQQSNPMDVFMMDHNFDLNFDTDATPRQANTVQLGKGNPDKPLTLVRSQDSQLSQKKSILPSALNNIVDATTRIAARPGFTATRVPNYPVPPMESPSLEFQGGQQKAMSLVDALPFLLEKQQTINNDESRRYPDMNDNTTTSLSTPGPLMKTVKKKAAPKAATSQQIMNDKSGATLQLPSHLINEDELKAMSSSLKTLYANQLELQEQSYREQLDFFVAQGKRREDMLKDALIAMQEDYEQKIYKLKTEQENSHFPKLNQDLTHIASNLEKLTEQFESIKLISSQNTGNNGPELLKSMHQDMGKEMETLVLKGLSLLETNLMSHLNKLSYNDSQTGVRQKDIDEVVSKLNDILVNSRASLEQVLNNQAQLKSSTVDTILTGTTTALVQFRHADSRKKDKSAIQMKELRKDLRRLYSELDGKNDLIHRSQLNVELEQRAITQSVRDINTFLKVLNESSRSVNQTDSTSSQIATTIQAVQANVQNEMEIKLLREERKSLSESIAQIHVERRKLSDEKLNLERDMMQFEREKVRVRDIESSAQANLAEAENLKRQAEQIRYQESGLVAEAESKLHTLSKERIKLKEHLFSLEQTLMLKEQKLFQEKSEINREKEFMDRLREQSLCAGCLRGIKGQQSHLLGRSSGDGLELDFNPAVKISQILTPDEKAYFLQENRYLQELGESILQKKL